MNLILEKKILNLIKSPRIDQKSLWQWKENLLKPLSTLLQKFSAFFPKNNIQKKENNKSKEFAENNKN